MRCVHQHQEIVVTGKLQVCFQYLHFITAVLVEPNLANPKNIFLLQEIRYERYDLSGEHWVFSLLGINAKPSVMANAILRCSPWFRLRELTEIVKEALWT